MFILMDLQDLLVGLLQASNKQWGYSGYAVNFPISFDIVYNVLSIPQNTASTSNSYWGRFYITNLTKNGFTVSDTGAGSNRWLAIGKAQPQWGYSTSTGEYVTHTFPIKFTVIPIVVAGALTSNTSGNTGSQSNPCYRSITVSNFVFCMYDNARGYAGSTYIAIGYQLQWGKGKTFSIPFPAQCLHVVATYASTKSADDNSDITVTATSTTGYITHKTYETFFLALGHQPQWGIISNNKAIFPLVFNLFVSSALLLNRGPGTGTWYGDSSNTTLTGISCVTPDYVLNGTYIAIGA